MTRTRPRDRIAAAIIVAAVAAVVAWTWWRAPARGVDHVVAAEPHVAAEAPARVPGSLTEIWSVPAPLSSAPFLVDGLALAADGDGVTAIDPATGEAAWSYHRDIPLCRAMTSSGRVITVFRGPAGCGEVTSLHGEDGSYAATRRSLSSDEVSAVRSNDRAGVFDRRMVELWRDDLVRTVEYGDVEASPEPGLQPHPDCAIADAVTRSTLLAVVDECPDGHHLVLQKTTPEESREPELDAEVLLGGPARLVAIGQLSVAVLVDGEVQTFSRDGRPGPSWRPADGDVPAEPMFATADLPHHITWFTGSSLVAFRPDDLSVAFTVPDALGTGTMVGGELLVPVRGGYARVNPDDGTVLGVIPLAREDVGPGAIVAAAAAGDVIVEKRGDRLVGLRAAA